MAVAGRIIMDSHHARRLLKVGERGLKIDMHRSAHWF